MVTRTERGWAGHYICSDRCTFRRNTLLEKDDIRIVISTVGAEIDIHAPGWPNKIRYTHCGLDRYYEIHVFHAKFKDPYWDIDVCQQISIDSPWALNEIEFESDAKANDMHEAVVAEITQRLEAGEQFPKREIDD